MDSVSRITYKTGDLRLIYGFSSKRKRDGAFIRKLRLEGLPVEGAAVQTRRRPGFQASDGKTEPFEALGKFNGGRFSRATSRVRPTARMNQSVEKRPRSNDDGACS